MKDFNPNSTFIYIVAGIVIFFATIIITKFKIYNNPGLKNVRFEGISNLSEVYIDCSKCGQFDVEDFLVKLTSCLGLSSITIRNANGLNLTESTLQFLLSIKNCILSGTFNIVDDLEADPKVPSAISFTTKQQLVNKFGNITDTNNIEIVVSDFYFEIFLNNYIHLILRLFLLIYHHLDQQDERKLEIKVLEKL